MCRRLWDNGGAEKQGIIIIIWTMKIITSIGKRIFVHHRIVSTVKREQFVRDRMSYIVLRGRWCNIVLNMLAPSKEKSYDLKTVL